ncbi:hypothetical protein EDD11_002474 [Mortierella claussenii]|nr:hypothetical protein EDD11_002474 [Mortierella claussenii]
MQPPSPAAAHYTFVRQLGQGRFCVVHLARHFYTGKLYAVKVIDKQAHKADILLRLRREIDLMESLDHPNIVKLHEVIETQFTINVCMEYVEGCSLEQHLKSQEHGKIEESEARRITRDLASAIAHCHSRMVVHRDIKPANILITLGGRVMLIDFGLGNRFSFRSRLNTICGSLPYYSPEIARGSNYTGPEVDIWCLGVVLYRMTVGRDPFVGSTKREVKLQITQDGFRPPATLSLGLQHILRTLLALESSHRRSLSILDNDPWLYEDMFSLDKESQQYYSRHQPLFLSEGRSFSENSRLSGTTLVRQSSKATTNVKRHSLTESCYYHGKTGSSLFGCRSLLADTLSMSVWHVDKDQPRFRKNRIRILPHHGARNDLLFQKDVDLSLLQFLMPILRACNVSYYLHSTSRILCGTSFVRDESAWSEYDVGLNNSVHPGGNGVGGGSMLLQKLVQQLGSAMTGGGSTTFQSTAKQCPVRYGVFSIDIVKKPQSKNNKKKQQQQQESSTLDLATGAEHVLVIKRLFGSSMTVQYFKKQFLYHATPRNPAGVVIPDN